MTNIYTDEEFNVAKKNTLLPHKCKKCKKIYHLSKKQILSKNYVSLEFCSQSCINKYNRSKGICRSKLEIWLEKQLTILYPNLYFSFNHKINNLEFDIMIPSLNLAFEINGIVHYRPIYGQERLEEIQKNDTKKQALCQELEIKFYVINTKKMGYFKPSKGRIYLNKIVEFINLYL